MLEKNIDLGKKRILVTGAAGFIGAALTQRVLREYWGCTVVGLDDMRLSEIEGQVSRLLQTRVHLTNEMDAGILAGVKVFIDGRIIDASYRKKLDELQADMRRS